MSEIVLTKDSLKKYEDILLNENMLFELNVTPQMVVNKDRFIIRVNKNFTTLFGYKSYEILGKQTVILTPSKEKFKEYAQYFKQTKDGFIKSEELKYKKKDGTIFWVKLEGNTINQQDDEVFILWSFIDVTKEVAYREELKLLASTDFMTKLYNRGFFTQLSVSTLSLAKRYKTAVSVIMLDIDKFKTINDTYGHKVGDDVIIKLAYLLKKISRKSDIVARWGGEEFLILLPKTDEKGAFIFAEKIRKEVELFKIILDDKQIIQFTISIGVTQINNNTDISIEQPINRADEALYKAKNGGRNKTCICN